MLLQLTINNFALIEKASLDFKEGFTILSGETGAGKSILIDAINYVQGSKFNKDLIRTGEEKTFVEAIFSIDDNERLKEILDDLEIEYDDTLIISREIGLARLPKNLREVAELRLTYPEESLKELGEMLEPPVGKSGVNHRLRKIEKIAEELRTGNF